MRKIKFRAWDDEEGMIPWDRLQIGGDGVFIVDKSKNRATKSFNIELMQYTGFKDINGSEIYEGDIVACKLDPEIVIGFIEIIEGWWCVNDGDGTFGYHILESFAIDKSLEVIGNIYETPELLEN